MTAPTFPTLPTGPHAHIALDYAGLRDEGLRLLGRLAGEQWTDFNSHDPGITILEQLCYAITDLAYRTAYPMPDLLAGSDASVALPEPAAILTCDPVTPADLRKLVLDVEGVGNAWTAPQDEPEVAFYHHPGSGELINAFLGSCDGIALVVPHQNRVVRLEQIAVTHRHLQLR